MSTLTPAKYWRVPCALQGPTAEPSSEFTLPPELANQTAPPSRGHGIAIASYDEGRQTGILSWIGIVSGRVGAMVTVDWKPTAAQIWVDTGFGRSRWKAGAFGFAAAKVADYGLHELWREHFDGVTLRDQAPMATRPRVTRPKQVRATKVGRIAAERLHPVEVIGEPTSGPHAGVVYVLKSAYGYKVGRTKRARQDFCV